MGLLLFFQEPRSESTPAELEPCYLKDTRGPNLSLSETSKAPAISEEVTSTGLLCISCRAVTASHSPTVPGRAGWISLTSADLEENTVEDYGSHFCAYQRLFYSVTHFAQFTVLT